MSQWFRDPALGALVAVVAGILVGHWVLVPVLVFVILSVLAAAAAFFTRGLALYGVLACLAAASGRLADQPLPAPPVNQTMSIRGLVLSRVSSGMVGVRLTPWGWKVLASTRDLDGLAEPGTSFAGTGAVASFSYPRNPGLFDFGEYYRRQGFVGRLTEVRVTARLETRLIDRLAIMPARARTALIAVVSRYLPGEEGALMNGLLFSEREGLTSETRRAFQRAGVTHILAVSGLNVSIIAGVVLLLLGVLRIRGWLAVGLAGAAILIYAGLAEFSASVVRAGLMFLFAFAGRVLERRTTGSRGLVLAALVILLAAPDALFDPGFQLSFGATAGLVLLAEPLARLLGREVVPRVLGRYLVLPVAVSLAAQLPTVPLVALHFHRLPLLAVLANLVIVPLVDLALPAGIVLLACAAVNTGLAAAAAESCRVLLVATLRVADLVGSIPWSSLLVGRVSWAAAALLLAALCSWFLSRPPLLMRLARAAAAMTFVLFAEFQLLTPVGPGRICLDLGGTYALVSLPAAGPALVIAPRLRATRVLEEFLDSRRVAQSVLVLPDRADTAAVAALVRHDRVAALVLGPEVSRRLAGLNVMRYVLAPGQVLVGNGLRIGLEGNRRPGLCRVNLQGTSCVFVLDPDLLPASGIGTCSLLVWAGRPLVLDSNQVQARALVGAVRVLPARRPPD